MWTTGLADDGREAISGRRNCSGSMNLWLQCGLCGTPLMSGAEMVGSGQSGQRLLGEWPCGVQTSPAAEA
jgi:hypothetical protein